MDRCISRLKIDGKLIKTEHRFLVGMSFFDKIALVLMCANRGGEYTWLEKETNDNNMETQDD